MSHSVHILRREVQAKYEASGTPELFENTENLLPFDAPMVERLESVLELHGFTEAKSKEKGQRVFTNEEWSARALLTKNGLYLSASGEGIFEIQMFASELADKTFAKFDPQEGSWE